MESIVEVIEGRFGIKLQKKGREHIGLCPFHGDKKPSMSVNESKGTFYCFACGVGGGVYKFYEMMGTDAPKAVRSDFVREIMPEDTWQEISPYKCEITSHFKLGKISKKYVYRTISGDPSFYVCRWDLEGGKKDIRPISCWNGEWVWKQPGMGRTLYNAHKLKTTTEWVIVVEGEKCADYLSERISDIPVLTWCGGANAISKSNWKLLNGMNLILWPDSDEAGEIAMEEIAYSGDYGKVFTIDVSGLPDKTDAADLDLDELGMKAFMKANAVRVR